MKSKYRAVVIVMMVFISTSVFGQSTEKKGWGYGIFGAGGASGYHDRSFLHYGGGVEILLNRGFGIGMEIGLVDRSKSDGFAVFSPGGIYAFNIGEKTMPFVTGGYSLLLYDERQVNGAFFGAGINHLIGDNWGIRVEGRDQIGFREGDTAHYLEARVGILFSWD